MSHEEETRDQIIEGLRDAAATLIRLIEKAGGVAKLAQSGVELGAGSWSAWAARAYAAVLRIKRRLSQLDAPEKSGETDSLTPRSDAVSADDIELDAPCASCGHAARHHVVDSEGILHECQSCGPCEQFAETAIERPPRPDLFDGVGEPGFEEVAEWQLPSDAEPPSRPITGLRVALPGRRVLVVDCQAGRLRVFQQSITGAEWAEVAPTTLELGAGGRPVLPDGVLEVTYGDPETPRTIEARFNTSELVREVEALLRRYTPTIDVARMAELLGKEKIADARDADTGAQHRADARDAHQWRDLMSAAGRVGLKERDAALVIGFYASLRDVVAKFDPSYTPNLNAMNTAIAIMHRQAETIAKLRALPAPSPDGEQARVQLAGCLMAVEGGEWPVSRDDYGWSLAGELAAELYRDHERLLRIVNRTSETADAEIREEFNVNAEPKPMKAGDRRVLFNGHPVAVDFRLVAEVVYQRMKRAADPGEWFSEDGSLYVTQTGRVLAHVDGRGVKDLGNLAKMVDNAAKWLELDIVLRRAGVSPDRAAEAVAEYVIHGSPSALAMEVDDLRRQIDELDEAAPSVIVEHEVSVGSVSSSVTAELMHITSDPAFQTDVLDRLFGLMSKAKIDQEGENR